MAESSQPAALANVSAEVESVFEFRTLWGTFRMRKYGERFFDRELGYVPEPFAKDTRHLLSGQPINDESEPIPVSEDFDEFRKEVEAYVAEYFAANDIGLKSKLFIWVLSFPVFLGLWLGALTLFSLMFPGGGLVRDLIFNLSGPFIFLYYAEVIFPRFKTRYLTRKRMANFTEDDMDETVPEDDAHAQLEFISSVLPEKLSRSIGQTAGQINAMETNIKRVEGLQQELRGAAIGENLRRKQQDRLDEMLAGYRHDLAGLQEFHQRLDTLNTQFSELAENLRNSIERGQLLERIDREEERFLENQGKIDAQIEAQYLEIEAVVKEIQHMLETTHIQLSLQQGDLRVLEDGTGDEDE